uniref:LITAF domain-containing protein n=1 Tax=Acrobeloides nanus TaxID=290746 RepID=A0A914DT21_9BILA
MFSTGVRIESWMLGCLPARVVCQRCKQEVVTQLGYETSSEECVKSILLFLLCLPLGACFYSRTRELTHRCPNCNKNIGRATDPRPDVLPIDPDEY